MVSTPLRVLLTVCVPCLLLGLPVLFVPVDLSFAGIMDRSQPEIERYFTKQKELGFDSHLIVLLEAPEGTSEQALDESLTAVAERIGSHPEVEEVVLSPDEEWFAARAAYLVEPPVFDALLRFALEPMDLEAASVLQEALGVDEESAQRRPESALNRIPGARLFEVVLATDPFDTSLGESAAPRLRELAEAVLEERGELSRGFTLGTAGMPAVTAEDQERTMRAITRASPVSLLLVLLVFSRLERRPSGLLGLMVPFGLAILAALGGVSLLLGSLTIMETVFGVIVFGLGIDFAVHLLARFREERSKGNGLEDSVAVALEHTGGAITAGAITTAGAFAIVGLAPDPVARHLGVSGALGLLTCLVAMLTVLPAIWVLQVRYREASGKHQDKASGKEKRALSESPDEHPAASALAFRFTKHATQHPRLHLVVAGLVLLAAALGMPRFHLETNLLEVFNRQVPSLVTVERVQQLFGVNGSPWIVAAEDLGRAALLEQQFEQSEVFERADSMATLLRPDALARHQRLRARKQELEQAGARTEGLAASPLFPKQLIEGHLEAVSRLLEAEQLGPPAEAALPRALARRYRASSGELLVYGYPKDSPFDGAEARRQRLAAQSIHPEATALGALLEGVMMGERPWLRPVCVGIVLFVALVLSLTFRSVRGVVLALIPVLFGVAVTFGALCWAGVSFNIMTLLVVPLLVGLGVDDGIHVVHRLREAHRRTGNHGAADASDPQGIALESASVGRAIGFTTATTCASFGALILTDHPGLESMALVMCLGLPLCLLASITVLPALAVLWRPSS